VGQAGERVRSEEAHGQYASCATKVPAPVCRMNSVSHCVPSDGVPLAQPRRHPNHHLAAGKVGCGCAFWRRVLAWALALMHERRPVDLHLRPGQGVRHWAAPYGTFCARSVPERSARRARSATLDDACVRSTTARRDQLARARSRQQYRAVGTVPAPSGRTGLSKRSAGTVRRPGLTSVSGALTAYRRARNAGNW
jgi:hypothetical protein